MPPKGKSLPDRIDWQSARDRIDLCEVATRLLGSPDRGRKWPCPFHEDRTPSFAVDRKKGTFRCYGCGEHGDAANLVMKIQGIGFAQAIAFLTGGSSRRGRPAIAKPTPKPQEDRPALPSGLLLADALALIADSEARLWSTEGQQSLIYLAGEERCLSPETIRSARLGWTPGVAVPNKDGDRYIQACGVVIPWFSGGRPASIKIRQPDGRQPKYIEAYRDPSILECYPGPKPIRLGRPLVVTEGEFDALLLGQALGDSASVVTLGGASAELSSAVLNRCLFAHPWYSAHDADPAGDKAAAKWPKHAIRVRPPGHYKDWTEASADGIDLARWWRDRMSGVEQPTLF